MHHLRPYLRNHHLQTGVGYYGVFSGRRRPWFHRW
jgi:poly(3-hydroxybutyrate) depolymerase